MVIDARIEEEIELSSERAIIDEMRQAIAQRGQHWFVALLEAIGRWRLPHEACDERDYRYLICGEAFDWLLLAERLCLEIEDLAPAKEQEDLLFHSRFPIELSESEFRRLLGAAKYRAHLNFVYGVLVEEALQVAVEQEVQKERRSSIWRNGHLEDEIFQHLYGATRRQMLERFAEERQISLNGSVSLGQLKEFTYWLFKHRVNHCDPARVASDTRKGLLALNRIQNRSPALEAALV
ncbi:MAG TPA: hypothetical protein VNL15_04600 [Dehalococcoidia bacterium]|nr:hypothetical protein [Dehalococcoidia bacterium]